MTKLLYMADFDIETCRAVVESIIHDGDGRIDIRLDQTCFYPRGGGQDWDTGTITNSSAVFRVEEARLDENGAVHHVGVFENKELTVGEIVDCIVDHDRRTVNTRLHSAGHIIDMAIDRLGLDWVATKGQHYPHLSAVEYSGTWDAVSADELREKIERTANELITKGTDNSLVFMPVAEMQKVVRHVPTNIPTNKPARVVMYGDAFGIPCGGTHVKNVGEVGRLHVPKLKEKKGVIRVNYSVEGIN